MGSNPQDKERRLIPDWAMTASIKRGIRVLQGGAHIDLRPWFEHSIPKSYKASVEPIVRDIVQNFMNASSWKATEENLHLLASMIASRLMSAFMNEELL